MIVQGDDRVLFIKSGSDFVPVACLTSNGMNESLEQLETTTRESGGWSTFRPLGQQYSINFEGLNKDDFNQNLFFSYQRLKLIKRNRVKIEWQIKSFEDATLIEQGFGYIVDISSSDPAGAESTFSGTLRGWGIPQITQTDLVLSDGLDNLIEDGEGSPIEP
jgi:hypothetical protein